MGSYGTYSDNRRNTDMLILADSPNENIGYNIDDFREKAVDSLDLLYQSSASQFFDGFFNVMVIEPLVADGESAIDMENDGNCVSWSDNTFCYSYNITIV